MSHNRLSAARLIEKAAYEEEWMARVAAMEASGPARAAIKREIINRAQREGRGHFLKFVSLADGSLWPVDVGAGCRDPNDHVTGIAISLGGMRR